MLSGKLIRLVEAHQEEIASRVLKEFQHHPDIIQLRKLPDADLRERCQQILENFGHWLAAGFDSEIVQDYEAVGRLRYEQSIPIHESIRALCIMKYKIIEFVDEQGIAKTSVQLYAEEELERRTGRFFDALVIYMARGWENAARRAAKAAAA